MTSCQGFWSERPCGVDVHIEGIFPDPAGGRAYSSTAPLWVTEQGRTSRLRNGESYLCFDKLGVDTVAGDCIGIGTNVDKVIQIG